MSRKLTMPIRPPIALFIVIIGLVAYGSLRSKSPEPEVTNPTIARHASQSLSDRFEVELVTLRPEGFEPSEVTRPKGAFVLLIDDRSGQENSFFELKRLKGERLRNVKTNRKKSDWYDLIDLPPGDYVLTGVDHAEKRCLITILP